MYGTSTVQESRAYSNMPLFEHYVHYSNIRPTLRIRRNLKLNNRFFVATLENILLEEGFQSSSTNTATPGSFYFGKYKGVFMLK